MELRNPTIQPQRGDDRGRLQNPVHGSGALAGHQPVPVAQQELSHGLLLKEDRISAWGANSSGCLRPGLSAQECQKDNTALDTRAGL